MREILIGLVFTFFVVGAVAQGNSPGGGNQVTITEVLVDFDQESISIAGSNVTSDAEISLGDPNTLGDITSMCSPDVSTTPDIIACDFSVPGLPPDGDYLLTVSIGSSGNDKDEYDLTIRRCWPRGSAGHTR